MQQILEFPRRQHPTMNTDNSLEEEVLQRFASSVKTPACCHFTGSSTLDPEAFRYNGFLRERNFYARSKSLQHFPKRPSRSTGGR
jgi:hypothetical protein